MESELIYLLNTFHVDFLTFHIGKELVDCPIETVKFQKWTIFILLEQKWMKFLVCEEIVFIGSLFLFLHDIALFE